MLVTNAPFELGETLQGTDANGNLINAAHLGQIYQLPYNDLTGPTPAKRKTGKPIYAIVLRNLSGSTLYGQRLAGCKKTAGFNLVESVDGYSTTLAQGPVVAIDPYLLTGGVAANDLFWGIISGPTLLTSPLSGAAFNATAIAVGDNLIAVTGVTTGAITSGMVGGVAIANATDAQGAFNQAANVVAQAMSALASTQTGVPLLVNMTVRL